MKIDTTIYKDILQSDVITGMLYGFPTSCQIKMHKISRNFIKQSNYIELLQKNNIDIKQFGIYILANNIENKLYAGKVTARLDDGISGRIEQHKKEKMWWDHIYAFVPENIKDKRLNGDIIGYIENVIISKIYNNKNYKCDNKTNYIIKEIYEDDDVERMFASDVVKQILVFMNNYGFDLDYKKAESPKEEIQTKTRDLLEDVVEKPVVENKNAVVKETIEPEDNSILSTVATIIKETHSKYSDDILHKYIPESTIKQIYDYIENNLVDVMRCYKLIDKQYSSRIEYDANNLYDNYVGDIDDKKGFICDVLSILSNYNAEV